jgi:hypothetical protein
METNGKQTLEDYARKVRAMSSREFKAERPHNKFGEEIVRNERQYRLQIATLRCAIAVAIFSFLSVVATVMMGIVKW